MLQAILGAVSKAAGSLKNVGSKILSPSSLPANEAVGASTRGSSLFTPASFASKMKGASLSFSSKTLSPNTSSLLQAHSNNLSAAKLNYTPTYNKPLTTSLSSSTVNSNKFTNLNSNTASRFTSASNLNSYTPNTPTYNKPLSSSTVNSNKFTNLNASTASRFTSASNLNSYTPNTPSSTSPSPQVMTTRSRASSQNYNTTRTPTRGTASTTTTALTQNNSDSHNIPHIDLDLHRRHIENFDVMHARKHSYAIGLQSLSWQSTAINNPYFNMQETHRQPLAYSPADLQMARLHGGISVPPAEVTYSPVTPSMETTIPATDYPVPDETFTTVNPTRH